VIQIDAYIKNETTGSPKNLADKMNISERAVYKYLKFMQEDLHAPIEYSKMKITYYYKSHGGFCFKWVSKYNH